MTGAKTVSGQPDHSPSAPSPTPSAPIYEASAPPMSGNVVEKTESVDASAPAPAPRAATPTPSHTEPYAPAQGNPYVQNQGQNPYAQPVMGQPVQQGAMGDPYVANQGGAMRGSAHPPLQRYTINGRTFHGYLVSVVQVNNKTTTTYCEVLPDGTTRQIIVRQDKKGVSNGEAAAMGACAACCLICCCVPI